MEENTVNFEEALRKSVIKIKTLSKKIERYSESIAIIGMGCRYPGGGNSPEEFWHVLETGIDGITQVPKDRFTVDDFYDASFDVPGKMYTKCGGFLNLPVDLFDADFFGISPREAEEMDPQQRLLLEVTWETLENALIPPQSLKESATGLFVGMTYSDYYQLIIESKGVAGLSAYSGSGNAFSAAVGRVSYVLDLQGPCMAIDTACSSSLVAINSACESLRLGQCEQAIAGGVSLMLAPGSFIGACQAHMLAPDGHCKTFDKSADGYARAEGCGILLLKRLSDAQRDGNKIYAVIKSSAVGHGGATSGLTVPNGEVQEALIRHTYTQAGLKPDDIDYLEAHGTGTSLGDPIEVRAIGAAYGQRDPKKPLFLGSAKSNIGHAESAAGVAGVIKTVLALNHEQLPANLNFREVNPHIELNFPVKILTENTPWPKGNHIRRAGVSSFGFSGVYAHLILEEAPAVEHEKAQAEERPLHILTLSAKTEAALDALIQSYQKFLDKTDAKLPDISYSANTGRNHERYRIAVITRGLSDIKEKLSKNEFIKGEAQDIKPYEFVHTGEWSKDLNELAVAYVNGAVVDWVKFDASYLRQKVSLPTYPFQRKSYWLKPVVSPRNTSKINRSEVVKATCTDERIPLIKSYIGDVLRSVLDLSSEQHLDERKTFHDFGMDSLTLTELNKVLKSGLEELADLPASAVFNHPTIELLSQHIANLLENTSLATLAHKKDGTGSSWLVHEKIIGQPTVRLFCFHHAGGSASNFRDWQKEMPPFVEVHLVQLPGRERRYDEPLISDASQVVDAITHAMLPYIDQPYILFGHSLGAMLASEVARKLQEMQQPSPQHLILSAYTPL